MECVAVVTLGGEAAQFVIVEGVGREGVALVCVGGEGVVVTAVLVTVDPPQGQYIHPPQTGTTVSLVD